MLRHLLLCLIICCAISTSAQTGKAQTGPKDINGATSHRETTHSAGAWYQKLQPSIHHQPRYQPKAGAVILKMDFALYHIYNPNAVKAVQERVKRVDLVYTRYPYHLDEWEVGYDSLMERRFTELHKLLPRAFTDSEVEWRLVLQTDCRNMEEAKGLFHGFSIYSGPNEGPGNGPEDSPGDGLTTTFENPSQIDTLEFPATTDQNPSEIDLPTPPKTAVNTVERSTPESPRAPRFDSVDLEQNLEAAIAIYSGEKTFYDSTCQWVFERHPEWGTKVLIIDWTASMFKHGAQVIHWIEEMGKGDEILGLVFFNDGNDKWDNEKVVGSTGGIYTVEGFDRDSIMAVMKRVSYGGSGGDHRENDLEAVLEAMDWFPEAQEFVLIADNSGPVRDMELLKNVERPLRIIICGVYHDRYEPDYLDIAHQTGGSIHSKDQDLEGLGEIGPFESLEFEEETYILVGGKFKRIIH